MKKNVTIKMRESLEATPIAHLVQLANQFQSQVYIEMDTKKGNAKSIMGTLSLVLTRGTEVTIDAQRDDEEKAVVAIEEFLTK